MTTYATIFPKDAFQRLFLLLLTHPAQVFPASDRMCSGLTQRPCAPWKRAPTEHSVRSRFPRIPKIKGSRIHIRILRAFEPHLPRCPLVAQRDIAHFEGLILGETPHQPILIIGIAGNGFAHLNGFVGGQFDENIRKRHGFREENTIFQRRMRIACDSLQQCRGSRERSLLGTIRQWSAREFTQFGGIRGMPQTLVSRGQRLEIRRNLLTLVIAPDSFSALPSCLISASVIVSTLRHCPPRFTFSPDDWKFPFSAESRLH